MSVLDPMTAESLLIALAAGPAKLHELLSGWFTALPGVRTVTYLATAPDRSVTRRVGTSDPEGFPLGASDPVDGGPWSLRIFGEKQPVVGNTPDEMALYIPETADLVKMGYGSTLCAPIVISGEVRGTVNLLGDAHIFTPALLAEVNTLLPIAALIFTFEGIGAR